MYNRHLEVGSEAPGWKRTDVRQTKISVVSDEKEIRLNLQSILF